MPERIADTNQGVLRRGERKAKKWHGSCVEKAAMPLTDLQAEPMMAHLLATLNAGHSIGHYGRLVFTMVARHFLEPDELIACIEKDPEVDQNQARGLVLQVESRGYNPPKRERILEWMGKQDFPICPDTEDPGQCNVYRNLEFPEDVYNRIASFYTGGDSANTGTASSDKSRAA
jgi:hypothetical protein